MVRGGTSIGSARRRGSTGCTSSSRASSIGSSGTRRSSTIARARRPAVFETDFGRIAVRICADEWFLELDRCYAIGGADIVFTPTQSWGPDAIFRDLRDISRAMDGGYYLVECTHPSTEARHRTKIIDPAGAVVASSEYRRAGIVSAEIDLDAGRPVRALRVYDPHKPGGYLREFQPERMPRVANDLLEAILAARRPDLYGDLAPK